MTVPVESDMRGKEAGSSDWYTGVDLEWRPSPPPSSHTSQTNGHGHHGSNGGSISSSSNGVNGSRKRSWEDAATPVQDATPDVNWNIDLGLLPDHDITPPFGTISHNGSSSVTLDNSEDGVEEIPRTKMQTGCIPCL